MREAVGSSPSVSTTSEQAAYRLLRLFSKVRACSFRCSSFSAKGRVRVACSLVNALTTALAHYQPFAGAGTQGSCVFFVVPYHVGAKSALLLLFAKSHARLTCSVAGALTTVRCRYQLFASFVGISPPAKTVKTSSPQAAYRLRRLFCKSRRRAHSAASPFRKSSRRAFEPLPKAPSQRFAVAANFLRGAGRPHLFHSPLPAHAIYSGEKSKEKRKYM